MKGKYLGDLGEDLACAYLEPQGYKIIERNYKSKIGEIDIITKEGNTLFFIEVKAKSNQYFGLPQEIIDF